MLKVNDVELPTGIEAAPNFGDRRGGETRGNSVEDPSGSTLVLSVA